MCYGRDIWIKYIVTTSDLLVSHTESDDGAISIILSSSLVSMFIPSYLSSSFLSIDNECMAHVSFLLDNITMTFPLQASSMDTQENIILAKQ